MGLEKNKIICIKHKYMHEYIHEYKKQSRNILSSNAL